MAVFKNASIKLDSPQNVFYPGQVITGSLEIEIEAPLTFSGNVILISFILYIYDYQIPIFTQMQ